MKTFGLKDKTILVTGADGFLGGYICDALREEGAIVYPIDQKTSSHSVAVDISDKVAVENYIEKLYGFGEIDGLVNNAAVSFKGNNITDDEFEKTTKVNIQGTYNCMTVVREALQNNASIVNIASIYGMLSPDFKIYDGNEELYSHSVYGASKAAIIQMTRYYASQFAPVRVNAVSPGGIYQWHKDSFTDKYSSRVPLGRMANPEEIVNAILFLLSPLSSYISGHNLVVDGGLSAQ